MIEPGYETAALYTRIIKLEKEAEQLRKLTADLAAIVAELSWGRKAHYTSCDIEKKLKEMK